jgi:hypothetical protein
MVPLANGPLRSPNAAQDSESERRERNAMNPIRVALVASLATVGLAHGSAAAAFIARAGSGYAAPGYASSATAELRHLKSDAADFELGFKKSGANGYAATAHATWIKGINDIAITYDTATSMASVSLNGRAVSTELVSDPAAITLHLIARNTGSNDAWLSVQNLAFNGSEIDTGSLADYLFASSKPGRNNAPGNHTHATITDASMANASWSITGQIVADWTGNAPTKAHSRLDISFSQDPVQTSAPVPTPATASLAAIALLAIVPRRRTVR